MISSWVSLDECVEKLKASVEEDAKDHIVDISDVMLIVNVNYGVADDGSEGEMRSTFYRSSSAKRYVQLGLLAEGKLAVLRSSLDLGYDDSDEIESDD